MRYGTRMDLVASRTVLPWCCSKATFTQSVCHITASQQPPAHRTMCYPCHNSKAVSVAFNCINVDHHTRQRFIS